MSASMPARTTPRFGASALNTPANRLTLGRLVLAVPTLLLIAVEGASWTTVALWFVLTVSDLFDGALARRHGTTRSGAFLDPLVDKVLVLGALFVLAARGDVPWLPGILIAVREVGVSLYRSWASRRGFSLPARRLGKYKTFVQNLAVGGVLLPLTENWKDAQLAVLWIAVVITWISGVDFVANAHAHRRAEARRAL